VVYGLRGGWGGQYVDGGAWWSEWAMGIIRFNETWWVGGHGMFSAHEVGGLLWTSTPLFKNYLSLQGNLKSTKLITQY
jgi:hypothetical protein